MADQAKGRQRLNDFANSLRGEPFEWGRTDCAALVVGAVNALTGSETLKHSWKSQRGLRGIESRENGFSGVLAPFCDVIENPNFITSGDVLIAEDGQGAMIALGKRMYMTSDHDAGVEYVKMDPPEGFTIYRVRDEI